MISSVVAHISSNLWQASREDTNDEHAEGTKDDLRKFRHNKQNIDHQRSLCALGMIVMISWPTPIVCRKTECRSYQLEDRLFVDLDSG